MYSLNHLRTLSWPQEKNMQFHSLTLLNKLNNVLTQFYLHNFYSEILFELFLQQKALIHANKVKALNIGALEENKGLMSSLRSSSPKYNEAYLEDQYFATKTSDCRWKNYDLDSFIKKHKPDGLDKYPVINFKVCWLHEVITKIRSKSK